MGAVPRPRRALVVVFRAIARSSRGQPHRIALIGQRVGVAAAAAAEAAEVAPMRPSTCLRAPWPTSADREVPSVHLRIDARGERPEVHLITGRGQTGGVASLAGSKPGETRRQTTATAQLRSRVKARQLSIAGHRRMN